jgi:alpha-beta hydrolase superfamily lysophospholipase
MFDRAEHEVMMERPEIRNAVFNKIAAWFDTHRT